MSEIKNDFEQYVQKYAKKHEISIEEALQHALVKSAKRYYEGADKDVNKWW